MGYLRFVIWGLIAVVSFAAAAQNASPSPPPTEGAQDPDVQELVSGSPEWVAREYLISVREKGFATKADFLHPDEMDRFKSILTPIFAAESESGGRALMNATFGRDARMAAVRLADPADFLRRFARVMSVRMPDQPTDYDRLRVLGTVKEDEQTHVLVRLSSASATVGERLEVVTLLPYEGGWKLKLSPKLETAVLAMDRRGGERRPAPRLLPRPELAAPLPQPNEADKPAAAQPGFRAPQ